MNKAFSSPPDPRYPQDGPPEYDAAVAMGAGAGFGAEGGGPVQRKKSLTGNLV
jgi:hypothetical protein